MVIAPESPISSYSLLDVADKVIVFGSTMGIEAAYWHKPVICLAHSFYLKLEVAYNPKTVEELWSYIDTKDLKDKYNDDILKFGYLFMSNDSFERFKYIDNGVFYYNIFGKKYEYPRYCKTLGSTFIYMITRGIYRRISKLCCKDSFDNVPISPLK